MRDIESQCDLIGLNKCDELERMNGRSGADVNLIFFDFDLQCK
jgi:hypothetical protein